jgi:copper chaperone CopZ
MQITQKIKTKKDKKMDLNKKTFATLISLVVGIFLVAHSNAATVKRSNFIVNNLSCTSCLATIEAELKGVPGALGMNADLRSGRITVDHLSSLDHDQIATIISKLGYPAAMEWTGTMPEEYTNKFAANSRYRSGCSSGGCGVSVGAGSGPTSWKAAPDTGTISRTTLQVSNLSCGSCLSNIAAELRKLSGTYGMRGYLSRGYVLVDHTEDLKNQRIAAVISGLGYPARVVATNEVPAPKAYTSKPNTGSQGRAVRTGGGCNSRGPCNATSASWKKLYDRYVTQTNAE